MRKILISALKRGLLAFFVFSLGAHATSPGDGINNFHEVDASVYRGAQPAADGFKYLAKMGVKTIVDLRESGPRSAAEAELVRALGMHYESFPMVVMAPPTKNQITKILALLEDGAAGPVFVHCKFGADRTGAVIAAYRIDHDHWDNARALAEAMSYGMSPAEYRRREFVRKFHPLTTAHP